MEPNDLRTSEKYRVLCESGNVFIDMFIDSGVFSSNWHDALLEWLPPQFAHHYTQGLARKLLVIAISVAAALDGWDGESEIVTCTADALILHQVIELAKSNIELGVPWASGVPNTDVDFDEFEDCLFPDFDYEFLWDPKWDGIEDSDYAIAQRMFLRVDQWFIPYAGTYWVHPYCRPSDLHEQ